MRTLMSWSTGKDSAWALHVLRQQPDVDVVGLVTTVNAAFDRVAMHGVRRTLVEAQAEAAGLPLHLLAIPYPCPNAEYERIMGAFVARQAARGDRGHGLRRPVPGGHPPLPRGQARRDRASRRCSRCGASRPAGLARSMIDGGLEAYVTCVDPRKLPASFAGRRFDAALLAELPPGVDPCAENGEFHTFACAGPMFRSPDCRRRRRDRHPRRLRLLRSDSLSPLFSGERVRVRGGHMRQRCSRAAPHPDPLPACPRVQP